MADHTPAIELESAEGLTISSKGPLRSAATRDFLAGALGGALGIVLGQPLDTVRVRQQQACACSRSTLSTLGSMMRCEGLLSPCKGMTYPLAASALQSAIMFYAYGSAMRYMHGGSAAATTATTATAAATSSSRTSSGSAASTSAPAFSPGSEAAQPPSGAAAAAAHLPRPRLRDVALAGMVAGAAQAAFIAPIELLKIRMQLQTAPTGSPHYLRPGPMLRHVLRTEGLGGLFRGTLATLYRDIPGCGFYFLTYHAATRMLEPVFSGIAGGSSTSSSSGSSSSGSGSSSSARSGGSSGSSSFESSTSAAAGAVAPVAAAGTAAGVPATGAQMLAQLVAGGMAGTLGWLATYPADVVKTQLQSGRRHDEPAAHPGGAGMPPSSSFLACARRMYHTQGGAAAFYRGLAPTLQRAFVVNSVTFLGYEYVAAALDRQT